MTSDLREKCFPFFMAAFTFTVFFLVFHAVPEKGDYITAVFVFSAVLGWSAIIMFTPHVLEKRRLALHTAVSVLLPLVTLFLPSPFVRVPFWHWFLFGMMLISYLGLYLFIRIQSRIRNRCVEE